VGILKPFPTQKYNTIVLDPAWNIPLTGKVKVRPNRKEKLDYSTMSLEEVKNLPLGNVANIGSHIYTWTTNKMLPYTFDILKSWGVNYHLTLVWTKPNGMMPCFGYKFATEFCLLGFYGKPMQKFTSMAKLNWFKNPSIKPHSTKPGCFFDLVDEMSPSPKLEMFARTTRLGWDSWGDEV
jgi:N6-adenosine-specific RNA methylase IME4